MKGAPTRADAPAVGPPTVDGDAGTAVAAAAAALARADRIWLGTHLDPDGDAIGSLLGLAHVLVDMGKTVHAACQDAPPRDGAWLPGAAAITARGPGEAPAGRRYDLAVALDAGDSGRLGTLYAPDAWAAQPTLVIDHHLSNTGFGQVDCIVPAASSTCEILVDVIDALGAPIAPEAATCLLCGIMTDTIGFRTPSTTARTLRAAERLVGAGANIGDIARRVFLSRPLAALHLEGRVLDRLAAHGPFVVSYLTLADMTELGAAPEDGRGIVQAMATAAEPLAVALVRERADGTFDVSLRAKGGVDLTAAARSLGGGGHALAAGARTAGPLDAALDAVRRALSAHVAEAGA